MKFLQKKVQWQSLNKSRALCVQTKHPIFLHYLENSKTILLDIEVIYLPSERCFYYARNWIFGYSECQKEFQNLALEPMFRFGTRYYISIINTKSMQLKIILYFFRVHRKTFHRHLHSRSSSLEAEKDEESSSSSSEYSYQSSQFAGFTLGAAIVWYSITDTVKADQGESNKSTKARCI